MGVSRLVPPPPCAAGPDTVTLLTAAGSHWPLPNRQRRQQATPSLRSCHLAPCRAPTALPSRQQLPFILRPRPHKISLLASRFSPVSHHSSLVTTHHHHRWRQSVSVRQPLPPSLHHAPPDLRLPTPRAACRTTGPIARARRPRRSRSGEDGPHRTVSPIACSLSSRPARALILTATTSYPLAPPPSAGPRNYARPSGKPPPRAATAMRGAPAGWAC